MVVAPGPDERTVAGPPAFEIELGRNIRVRIAATAPKELACLPTKIGALLPVQDCVTALSPPPDRPPGDQPFWARGAAWGVARRVWEAV